MKSLSIIALSMVFFWAGLAHAEEEKSAIAEILNGKSSILTIENFLRIKAFVLSQGQRQTYCNMFNDNPYYRFTNFNLYLNPPDQQNINCETGKSDFPIIVIQTTTGGPNKYLDIRMEEKSNKLILVQHYSTTKQDVLAKEVEEFFREALLEIEKQELAKDITKK